MDKFIDDLHEPKSELKDFDLFKELNSMIERVNEGYENELEVYIMFSDAEKAFKAAKEKILEAALSERAKYEEKTLKFMGREISFTQSGRYDYSTNSEWVKVKKQLDDIQKDMKLAYISSKQGKMAIDENSEIVPLPHYTQNKKSLKIK